MHGASGAGAGQFGAGAGANRARVKMLGNWRGKIRQAMGGDEAGEFSVKRGGGPVAVGPGETVEYECVDAQSDGGCRRGRRRRPQGRAADLRDDGFHIQPAVSAVESVFSSLANSVWAAARRWFMRTGSWASAARNAALSARLRMWPPARLRRASFSTCRPCVGVAAGKTRRQISARWVTSGKGNWTVKRMRRENAVSSDCGWFVVRMTRPR